MLACSDKVPVLDLFRVPYEIDPAAARPRARPELDAIAYVEEGVPVRRLMWPRAAAAGASATAHRIGTATLLAPVTRGESSGEWQPLIPIFDGAGEKTAAVWQDAAGNIFLPFDPVEATQLLITERYRDYIDRYDIPVAR